MFFAIFFLVMSLCGLSHQDDEMSFTVSLKRSGATTLEEVRDVMMGLVPSEQDECCTKIQKKFKRRLARVEKLLSANRLKLCKAGMEDYSIGNNQITASSYAQHNDNHKPWYSRLNQHGGTHWWGVGVDRSVHDPTQWIQVDLKTEKEIYGIMTQGSGSTRWSQYIQTFKILYRSSTDEDFKYAEDGAGEVMIFQGNVNATGTITNDLPEPITARYVRINPITYFDDISMRFELLLC